MCKKTAIEAVISVDEAHERKKAADDATAQAGAGSDVREDTPPETDWLSAATDCPRPTDRLALTTGWSQRGESFKAILARHGAAAVVGAAWTNSVGTSHFGGSDVEEDLQPSGGMVDTSSGKLKIRENHPWVTWTGVGGAKDRAVQAAAVKEQNETNATAKAEEGMEAPHEGTVKADFVGYLRDLKNLIIPVAELTNDQQQNLPSGLSKQYSDKIEPILAYGPKAGRDKHGVQQMTRTQMAQETMSGPIAHSFTKGRYGPYTGLGGGIEPDLRPTDIDLRALSLAASHCCQGVQQVRTWFRAGASQDRDVLRVLRAQQEEGRPRTRLQAGVCRTVLGGISFLGKRQRQPA